MIRKFSTVTIMLCLLVFVFAAQSQTKKMTWTTKSGKARELATKGINHMMNLEDPQAYEYVKQSLELDPDFTVALVLMANLSSGSVKKAYSAKAIKSSANKTEGEKLFASLMDTGLTQDSRRSIWAKLYNMFPEESMMAVYYLFTRATPGEQYTVGLEPTINNASAVKKCCMCFWFRLMSLFVAFKQAPLACLRLPATY